MTDKKKSTKMDDEETQRVLSGIIDDSVNFLETSLAPARAAATKYYHAEPLGNEEEGRSQFVVSEVRDGVVGVIPSIIRVLFGADRAVEFSPRNAGTAEIAEQATDAIQYDFMEANSGFLQSYSVLKDGLIRKSGIFKWWWDNDPSVTAHKIDNITESELLTLAEQEDVEITRLVGVQKGTPATQPLIGPDGQPMGEGTPGTEAIYNVELTHTEPDGRARVVAVPPEEFIFNREARNIEDALFIGHRTRKTRGELIAMGIDEKLIDEHGGDDTALRDSEERDARATSGGDGTTPDPEAGKENERHLYIEAFVRIDYDGDGVAELRRICTLGIAHFPVVNEPAEEAPFAIFCPDPEPHTLLGQSWADRLMDVQRVKTMLTRAMLDSLALSIFPRTAYVEGQVNPQDLMNTEIGANIRMRAPGMVQPLSTPFVGKEAFPLLDYFDAVVERRTSQSRGTQGLDADALQSTTKQGVGAAISSSQEQTELLARIFAEGTLKPLFKGMLRLYTANKPKARTMRLRGKWVDVNPASWDADMDVVVNVALGTGTTEQKVGVLAELVGKMEQVFQLVGVQNPIFTLENYANAIKQILSYHGVKDARPYMQDVDPKWEPPAPPEPQQTPEQVLAQAQLQVEQMKAQKDIAIKQAELQLKTTMADRDHALATRRLELEMELHRYEIDLKYQAQQSAQAQALRQQDIDADIAAIQADREHEINSKRAEHEQAVAEHDQMMAQQAHEQEMQAAQAAQQAGPETAE